jgi:hypothetical protein
MLDFYLIPTIMIVYIGIRKTDIMFRNSDRSHKLQTFEHFKGKNLDFYGILTNNDFNTKFILRITKSEIRMGG